MTDTPNTAKKKKRWPWIVGGIVAVIAVAAVTTGGEDTTTPDTATGDTTEGETAPAEDDAAASNIATVVYEVTGTGTSSMITYTTDGQTDMEQVGDVELPWEHTIELPADDPLLVVQVSGQQAGTGEISCRITVDGEEVAQATSDGDYVMASCSESIGAFS
ncbi:MmpS family transport accessory protein [Actinoalloteichus hymeniacidonis]|uniref:Membrane protein n=1 Tax=Actinoalloteichus hymeniacidonis TaxID=340345 RepID=A0AAC9HKZ0_9PSEU|nr:MmpS family transport accessory protein [Actinoalloteichus hymeniacidonis]AOS61159.1 membrane protein [Actinoalloteichus hymeniacidonis]MBB5910840.1 hypothetical protein [Actinoalloteichus hymeniacidonis]